MCTFFSQGQVKIYIFISAIAEVEREKFFLPKTPKKHGCRNTVDAMLDFPPAIILKNSKKKKHPLLFFTTSPINFVIFDILRLFQKKLFFWCYNRGWFICSEIILMLVPKMWGDISAIMWPVLTKLYGTEWLHPKGVQESLSKFTARWWCNSQICKKNTFEPLN